ncbi:hypothetical protein KFK09_001742 [Dendrobium nobile]|uniref:Retrotransposon gag protein n=1 Tax=Dendrobium nobile TaxID=94219 RepID=A0A8T3CBR3_DENNO|nr:hypothetical protein KFK09_001742 [Dendrobium nobile]
MASQPSVPPPPPPQPAKRQPFQRESVKRILKSLLKKPDFQLLEARRPEDESKKDDPKYCPYQRMLSHPLEDCVVFKDWLEMNYTQGNIIIPKEYLVDPEKASIKTISGNPLNSPYFVEDGWDIALFRALKKSINKYFHLSQQLTTIAQAPTWKVDLDAS